MRSKIQSQIKEVKDPPRGGLIRQLRIHMGGGELVRSRLQSVVWRTTRIFILRQIRSMARGYRET